MIPLPVPINVLITRALRRRKKGQKNNCPNFSNFIKILIDISKKHNQNRINTKGSISSHIIVKLLKAKYSD